MMRDMPLHIRNTSKGNVSGCAASDQEMKMVLVLLWAAGAIVLGIGVFELFLTGSLGEILKKEETKTSAGPGAGRIFMNLLWLSRIKNRKAAILGISVGSLLFAWCHQMLVPAVISGVWIAVLICLGRWLNGWLMGVPEKDAGSDEERMGEYPLGRDSGSGPCNRKRLMDGHLSGDFPYRPWRSSLLADSWP